MPYREAAADGEERRVDEKKLIVMGSVLGMVVGLVCGWRLPREPSPPDERAVCVDRVDTTDGEFRCVGGTIEQMGERQYSTSTDPVLRCTCPRVLDAGVR
jgi:hypothetical protein